MHPQRTDDLVVTAFEAWPVDLRLTDDFTISKGSVKVAENVFLRLTLASGITGFGEVAPLPQLMGADRASHLRALERLRTLVVGQPAWRYRRLSEAMAVAEPAHPAARAGVETALLDAFCRGCGIPMWALWGGAAPEPRATDVTLPILPLDRCLELAEHWWTAGFRIFKLKVGAKIDEDLERLEHLVGRHPEASFILDANQGFSVDDGLRFLAEASRLCKTVRLYEQPVAAADLDGMARIAASTAIPVAADESVMSAKDALEVVRRKAADVVNLKIMRCGVLESVRIAQIAHAAGLGLMIGGMVESRLAMSCSLSLVYGLGWIHHCDLDTPLLLADDPVRGGYRYDGPRMSVWMEPGLGVEVQWAPAGTGSGLVHS
jgi:L-Ala-D/L-Glu epimerase / N-acetyl-D-glutamate racemase